MFSTFFVSFIYLEKTSFFSDLQNVMAFKNSKKKQAISSNNVIYQSDFLNTLATAFS